MKTERKILTAFILNLFFAIFEAIGGVVCGSTAILSDALHDTGDALSIGISFILEKKSRKEPDEKYTYGYLRYSVLGGFISTLILLFGSVAVIYNAVNRIFNPTEINYNGMIIFAVVGVIVNFCAAFFTRDADSLNQKAVNLHMLEDVLGWLVVLIGAVVMRFTDFSLIDPLMSVGVALFIGINAIRNLKEIVYLFLEKIPDNINPDEIRKHITEIDGVIDVHHIHIRSIDGNVHSATMHVVSDSEPQKIKKLIREELLEHGIAHVTIETEDLSGHCDEKFCNIANNTASTHTHYHHNHH